MKSIPFGYRSFPELAGDQPSIRAVFRERQQFICHHERRGCCHGEDTSETSPDVPLSS
jgi:hypothetical protein